MKTRLIIAACLLAGAFLVVANDADKSSPRPEPEYPVTGMTALQVEAAFKEIKSLLPVGPRILSIMFENENKVLIQTGKISGPLAGHGKHFVFEKIDGKWKKTKETSWVS